MGWVATPAKTLITLNLRLPHLQGLTEGRWKLLGLTRARCVCPIDVWRSVLYRRQSADTVLLLNNMRMRTVQPRDPPNSYNLKRCAGWVSV